jgi:hypothetical protein
MLFQLRMIKERERLGHVALSEASVHFIIVKVITNWTEPSDYHHQRRCVRVCVLAPVNLLLMHNAEERTEAGTPPSPSPVEHG